MRTLYRTVRGRYLIAKGIWARFSRVSKSGTDIDGCALRGAGHLETVPSVDMRCFISWRGDNWECREPRHAKEGERFMRDVVV